MRVIILKIRIRIREERIKSPRTGKRRKKGSKKKKETQTIIQTIIPTIIPTIIRTNTQITPTRIMTSTKTFMKTPNQKAKWLKRKITITIMRSKTNSSSYNKYDNCYYDSKNYKNAKPTFYVIW